jgi:hypothetical protein
MRRVVATLATLALVGCAVVAPPSYSLRVFDMKQGLARLGSDGSWYIYEYGTSFRFQVNGQCDVAGTQKPCMWHAAEFEFESSEETSRLDCVTEFSEPIEVVTPRRVESAPTRRFEFTFELQGRGGRRVFPGYVVAANYSSPSTSRTTCEHAGRRVFQEEFTVLPAER